MSEKINLYRDGEDVFILVKNCSTSFLDIIKKLVGAEEDPIEIPVLEPVADGEPPKIPEEKPEDKPEEKQVVEENLEKVQEEVKSTPPPVEPEPVTQVPDPVPEEIGTKCPNCGETLVFGKDGINCKCGFVINRVYSRKELSDEDLVALIECGETPIYDDFISSKGKPYSAKLTLRSKVNGKVNFVFTN